MLRWLSMGLCGAACSLLPMVLDTPSVRAADSWNHWRGADQQGVAPGSGYPVRWEAGDSVQWRFEVPGRAGSTPVVAGDKVFLTTGDGDDNLLLAVAADTGKPLWDVTLGQDRGGKHKKGSGSNPSPTTDGELVYAYYRSGDLGCVDTSGKVRWHRNIQEEYGEDTLWWDLGSSPLLTDTAVVIAVMQSGPSYLVAFDKQSGEQLWKVDRMVEAPDESAQSYTSPLLTTVGDQKLIAVLGADHLTLHDAETGKELARLGGFNPAGERYFRSIASPVISGNVIVCPYARGSTLTAVDMSKLLAAGSDAKAAQEAILWEQDFGADVPTPSARDGRLYLCGDKGHVRALDVQTGKTLWEVELPKNRNQYSSSPLVTASHLYLTREDGHVFVIALPASGKTAEEGKAELVGENELGDEGQYTVASPVPLDGDLLFRTRSQLVRVGG
ncbi:outer membrane protein assembly factor BamB family protein [Candidatus Laterigemmans baculatus]|uniref:outer membrane protein assembly factor BamB family protein n=1 Tax=Candidatus Laterigemmans baculatus TaxID=2770505 RepID=UPI0013DB7398|nr:PQQ-binding-like beta-propeller repeat protein [Candidatus Laterigemmans baculatus]